MIGHPHVTFCLAFLTALHGLLATNGVRCAEAAETMLPITATAKEITTAMRALPLSPMQTAPLALQPVEPTLPDGKLPQYQLGYHQRDLLTAKQRENGAMLLNIEMPQQRLIVKATIRIDGEPFPLLRARRVAAMLARSQTPVAARSPSDELHTADKPDQSAEQVTAVQASAEADSSEASSSEASMLPPTVAEYRIAADPVEMLRRYADAIGEPLGIDEARWLFVHWSAGPELLLLNHHFQGFRGGERPVFHVMDRDRDLVVSAEELESAVESLSECDTNGDGTVDVAEIERAAKDPRRSPNAVTGAAPAAPAALLTLIQNSDSPPDVELLIDFDSASPVASTISLMALAPALKANVTRAEQSGHTITLYVGQTPILFSAVQDPASDQISLGGVVDGYPLLPIVDPNNDGRFTVRELRSLVSRLKPFDVNLDGQLTSDEAVAPIRVCFGRGATVHRELANLRDVPAPPSSKSAQSPEWFARMDRNQDGDLTRGEFPGTDEQFRSLDADDDELISAAEASAFDQPPSPKAAE